MARNVLLLIDPQRDFCEGGKLAVTGGQAAMDNVASFIRNFGTNLDDIVVTYDSHHPLHIAHPIWFLENGKPPEPFTAFMEDDGQIVTGTLDANGFHSRGTATTRNPRFMEWTRFYLKELAAGGRYPHMGWPPHCLIGSVGACATENVFEAIRNWEETEFGVASKVTKGSNIKVEHFGALRAEVVDPDNIEGTGVNAHFLSLLSDPGTTIYGAGLALSHCLANTARDTADEFDGDSFCERFVLLEDCTASVDGLEFLGEQFVSDFTARGMKSINSTDV